MRSKLIKILMTGRKHAAFLGADIYECKSRKSVRHNIKTSDWGQDEIAFWRSKDRDRNSCCIAEGWRANIRPSLPEIANL